jgi:hypothetical protein
MIRHTQYHLKHGNLKEMANEMDRTEVQRADG